MFDIPVEKLPHFAKDEDSLNVLFAPIRSRSVNPRDWENKITSWKTLVKLYCDTNDIYSFSLTSLSTVFVRHGRSPSCLKDVIEDMVRNKEIQAISEFTRKGPSESWIGWASDMLFVRPVSWSYDKIKRSVFTKQDASTSDSYVHLETVKEKAEQMYKLIPENLKNKLISMNDVLELMSKTSKHSENVKLILHVLQSKKKADVTLVDNNNKTEQDNDSFLIKFGENAKITEVDVGIYTLEKNEKLIAKHTEELEDEIAKCVSEAKEHLRKNHRQLAKSCLVKKHNLEKRLQKKLNALHNVQNLLEQLKDTHSDAHVWEAYKNALNAFNTTYKETGLNEDAVEDTMIKLGETLDIHDDIQSALSRPAREEMEDTEELEKELADLMRDDVTVNKPPDDDSGMSDDLEQHLEKLNLDLPTPPKESPDISLEATTA